MNNNSRSYNNIYITGMPGTGKTTFGRQYAYFTQRAFIDFDDFFEKTFNTKISKVFSTQGIEGFRKKESQLLQLVTSHSNKVIALGGGTLLRQDNFNRVKKEGLIVSLIGLSADVLANRILKDSQNTHMRKRPLFNECQNFEQILEKVQLLWQERKTTYLASDLLLNQNYNSNDNLLLSVRSYEKKFIHKIQKT